MNKKIESFTGLRFVMIMTIVIGHLEFLKYVESVNDYFPKYWNFQILGVNFFFLLSGFGMMLGNLRRIVVEDTKCPTLMDGVNFGVKHVSKIYPLYIVTMVIGLVASVLLAFYHEMSIFKILWHNAVKLVLAIPLIQTSTGMREFGWAYNGVCWFLSCLFCIYLISPWLIYFLRKYSKSYTSDILLIVLDLVFIVGLAYLFGEVEMYSAQSEMRPKINALVYGSPYRRVFYVLIGMSLAMIYNRLKNANIELSVRNSNILEVIVCIVAIVYYLLKETLPLGLYHYIIDLLICAAVIIVFSFDKGNISVFLSTPLMQKLGNMAMYIFLIHYPIRFWGAKIIEHYFEWNLWLAIGFIIVEFSVTYLLSDCLYERNLKVAKM